MVVLFDTEGYRTLDVDIAVERGLLRPERGGGGRTGMPGRGTS